ncbi:MAG: type II secretion system F family protein [Pirellulaceae bacterium]
MDIFADFRSLGFPDQVQLKTEAGKEFSDKLKLRFPLFGVIFQNLAVARFCRVLGTLLKNGVSILRALEISREAAGNKVISKAISEATENITSGGRIVEATGGIGAFSQKRNRNDRSS